MKTSMPVVFGTYGPTVMASSLHVEWIVTVLEGDAAVLEQDEGPIAVPGQLVTTHLLTPCQACLYAR